MRPLCSLGAIFWEATPEHDTLSGIPLTIFRNIIGYVLQVEVIPQLHDHYCDTSAPCAVLRGAMQTCIPLLSVCKVWNALVSTILKGPQYSKFRLPDGRHRNWSYASSWRVGLDFSLGGRYRAYNSIEEEHEKSVLEAYDYGSPNGCHGKSEVIIKISSYRQRHENEQDFYAWLATTDIHTPDVPKLYFHSIFGPDSKYYGLVLTKLGPDLERLRVKCRHKRFTPRMTLAVAIQTIRIYERLHAQGWLHCNAKLGNFAIGPDSPGKNSRIFMFDFEYSQHIEPTPCTKAACTGWNALYKPVTWEMRLTPSRRDDLEGLGYVFSYLERGSHPWEHISSEEIWRLKICTPTKKIFEGMDPVYVRYFDEVKALAWGEVPDYDGIVKRFIEVWEKKGYGDTPGEIDWWSEFGLRAEES